jgi:hypothetical protein
MPRPVKANGKKPNDYGNRLAVIVGHILGHVEVGIYFPEELGYHGRIG